MFRKLGIVLGCAVVLAVYSSTTVKAETQAAAHQRQEQEKAAEQKLTELDKKMKELAAETKKAEGKAQAELNRLYEDFKKQQTAAKGSLEELRKSTNETWDKAKASTDKALENLNGLYERSKAKAKESSKDAAK
jgi:biopolymer transport protein ExbB/TolQ